MAAEAKSPPCSQARLRMVMLSEVVWNKWMSQGQAMSLQRFKCPGRRWRPGALLPVV